MIKQDQAMMTGRNSHRSAAESHGWIYVLEHPVLTAISCVKIGQTSRDPSNRLSEIASQSGWVAPGRVAYCLRVSDRKRVENAIKDDILRHKRVRRRRELFRCTAEEAMAAIEQAAAGVDSAPWLVGRPKPRRAYTRQSYCQRRIWPAPRRYRRRSMFEIKAFVFCALALTVIAFANGWIR